MWFKHIDPSKIRWYYIDASQDYGDSLNWKPEEHDGSSVAKADKELPATLTDNTVYLIRRSNHKWNMLENQDPNRDPYPFSWCYNNVAGCTLPAGSLRIAIVGMPKQDDPLFQYMPEQARTAWVDNVTDGTRDYAPLAQNMGNGWYKNADIIKLQARDVVLYNLYIMTNSQSSVGNGWQNAKYYIYVNCENFIGAKLYTCQMRGDLNQPNDVVADGIAGTMGYDVFTPTTCGVFYTNTCHIYDSTLVNKPDSYENGWYFRLYSRFGQCTINNITLLNIPLSNNQGSDRYNHCGFFHIDSVDGSYRSLTKVHAYNIHMYLYRTKTSHSYNRYRKLLTGQTNTYNVHDITIEEQVDSKQIPDATNYALVEGRMVDITSFNPGSIVSNITMNVPKCFGFPFFSFTTPRMDDRDSKMFTPKSQWYIVKNISFIGTGQGASGTWGSKNTNVINIEHGNSSYEQAYLYLVPTCEQLIVQNISITSYYNTNDNGLYLRGAMVDMVNNHLQCKASLYRCTGKIGSIKTYDVGGAFTDNAGANLLYIGSITCNRNNPDSPYIGQQAISPSWKSQILVGSTNTRFLRDDNMSDSNPSNLNDHMYLCTSDLLEGNFVARNIAAKAETWSVYRTGGHSCTLRFVCQKKDIENYPLRIGDMPFAGIKRHLQKGINRCTFYMTTTGYNSPAQIKDKMRFRAKLPSGLYVCDSGDWSDDPDTVWNNVELNTSFKYTFYIDMEAEGDVEFSYQFWWYMLDAYTYLDPFPAVELVQ